MPDALSDRLDTLCALVNEQGTLPGAIFRKHLVAALIAFADEDATRLQELLERYTGLKVRDALVGDAKNAKVIELRPVKPGRRPA